MTGAAQSKKHDATLLAVHMEMARRVAELNPSPCRSTTNEMASKSQH